VWQKPVHLQISFYSQNLAEMLHYFNLPFPGNESSKADKRVLREYTETLSNEARWAIANKSWLLACQPKTSSERRCQQKRYYRNLRVAFAKSMLAGKHSTISSITNRNQSAKLKVLRLDATPNICTYAKKPDARCILQLLQQSWPNIITFNNCYM